MNLIHIPSRRQPPRGDPWRHWRHLFACMFFLVLATFTLLTVHVGLLFHHLWKHKELEQWFLDNARPVQYVYRSEP